VDTHQGAAIDHLRETLVNRRDIHRGRLLHVVVDQVRLDGGRMATRDVVLHPGAVAVVARDTSDRVVLVRQWRQAAGRTLWELPAGTRDVEGEDPVATARRELREETGVTAAAWRELGGGFLAPGYSSEYMLFYEAAELTEGEPETGEDERIEVARFTLAEVQALWRTGELDVKTVSGLALAGWCLTADE